MESKPRVTTACLQPLIGDIRYEAGRLATLHTALCVHIMLYASIVKHSDLADSLSLRLHRLVTFLPQSGARFAASLGLCLVVDPSAVETLSGLWSSYRLSLSVGVWETSLASSSVVLAVDIWAPAVQSKPNTYQHKPNDNLVSLHYSTHHGQQSPYGITRLRTNS